MRNFKHRHLPAVLALMAFASCRAGATTVIGDLNNFDTVNDTGHTCYGFEIEIDDIHSTDITYTFDWNHYGTPKIREDNTDPAHPKVFVRYESTKDSGGHYGANNGITQSPSLTNPAIPSLTPPQGHTCTDTTVNEGCEHFGIGYYGVPTAVKYNWLIDDGNGNLAYAGAPVSIATPAWNYTPPADAQPAQVVAVIPAPVAPVAGKEFGEPSWVKVVKTTTHNANPVALGDLISDDRDGDEKADWQNAEPSEVETEWKLLQARNGGGGANDELQGGGDDMGDGSENVTRRYEFYRYAAAADTLDGENGEAMCSEVNPATDPNDPLYLHGVGNHVAVTDANGDTYYVNCEAQVVVGNFIGAQMAGFAAAAPLGLIDHLQDGESGTPYPARTVVIGGSSPYTVQIGTGTLPPGLELGNYTDPQSGQTLYGVLHGTPTQGGDFDFTVSATDADGAGGSQSYHLHIAGAVSAQSALTVQKTGSGAGSVTGTGIDCGSTCTASRDAGTGISLTALADAGSRFGGWSGACSGTGACSFVLNSDASVNAEFIKQWQLSVSKTGAGSGTVSGNNIDCGAACTSALDQGTQVSLTATPAAGSYFSGWSGACTGTGTCNTAMDADKSVTAAFVASTTKYTLSVSLGGTQAGTVTSKPKGISCGKTCSKNFAVGTNVTLTAKPGKKHKFTGWSGDCLGTATTCTVPMLGSRNVTANFN